MAVSSQPIALPVSSNGSDSAMISGSYTGTNGSFNSAQLHHLVGTPSSWRAGSFGSRYYTGCSPAQFLDPNDFKFGNMSSSMESDHGSIHNAINILNREDELSHNFTCCGIHLTDLHAVVEHFEVAHVIVADQHALAGQYQNALSGGVHINPPSYYQDNNHIQTNYHHAFDPDDMELEMDNNSPPSSGGSTPPDTPITTPLSSHPTGSFNRYPMSNCTSPHVGSPPVSAFDTIVLPSHSQHVHAFPPSIGGRPAIATVPDAFNGYSGYSDYSSCMPGTVPSPPAYEDQVQTPNSISEPSSPSGCVPPALLYTNGDNTPLSTPSSSRIPSPTAGASYFTSLPGGTSSTTSAAGKTDSSAAATTASTPRASTTLSRPASSLLLSKPFRCPKPNCNKSYKQANGLKYHMTHGSCNFAPPKDLEQVQALLASKRSQRQAAEANGEEIDGSYGMISEGELREVEREAERRLRPFACGVADCQRRYKNMNGLRYHYQHSGDHGAIGLALLASGQHECLQHAHGKSAHSSRHSTPGGNANTTSAPAHAHQHQHQHQMQMQTQSQQYHSQQQQSQMQAQQMVYTSSAQQQYVRSHHHHQQQHLSQQQHSNPMTTTPLTIPSGGMYISREYMSA